MRYSIEAREWKYVKDYAFLSFNKSIGKNLVEDMVKTFVMRLRQKKQIKKQQKQSVNSEEIKWLIRLQSLNYTN